MSNYKLIKMTQSAEGVGTFQLEFQIRDHGSYRELKPTEMKDLLAELEENSITLSGSSQGYGNKPWLRMLDSKKAEVHVTAPRGMAKPENMVRMLEDFTQKYDGNREAMQEMSFLLVEGLMNRALDKAHPTFKVENLDFTLDACIAETKRIFEKLNIKFNDSIKAEAVFKKLNIPYRSDASAVLVEPRENKKEDVGLKLRA